MNRRGFIKLFSVGASVVVACPDALAESQIMAGRMPARSRKRLMISKATGLAVCPGELLEIVGEKGSRKMVHGQSKMEKSA